ncbi:MAG: hypothetical protein HN341_05980 [Verrucomicrobia bacterium]|jgi:tetratricopeptide (TPR) repeat protein|nr:hypothetical protein [Verrucomicrobiota bacterium]
MAAMLLVAVALCVATGRADEVDDAIVAFESSNFMAARRLSKAHQDDPRGRFVMALCCIHNTDTGKRDYAKGLRMLEALADDAQVGVDIRNAAKLTCARTAYLLDVTGNLPAKARIDYRAIFRELVAAATPVHESFAAAAFSARLATFSDRQGELEETREVLEAFAAKHADDRRLTPVCLWLFGVYTEQEKYEQSVPWLEKALALGIHNPRAEPDLLYTVARQKQQFVGDSDGAAVYYERYIESYPFHINVPRARKHLAEIRGEAKTP